MKITTVTLIGLCLLASGLGGCASTGSTGGAYGYATPGHIFDDPIHRTDDCNKRQFPQCSGDSGAGG